MLYYKCATTMMGTSSSKWEGGNEGETGGSDYRTIWHRRGKGSHRGREKTKTENRGRGVNKRQQEPNILRGADANGEEAERQ